MLLRQILEVHLEPCSIKNLCEIAKQNGGRHPKGVRGHKGQEGIGSGVKGAKAQLWEKYRQPARLWETIFRFPQDQTVGVQTVGVEPEPAPEKNNDNLPGGSAIATDVDRKTGKHMC